MKSKHTLHNTVSYPVIHIQDRLDDAIDRYANTRNKVYVMNYLYEHVNDNLHRIIYQGILTNMDEFINGWGTTI